MSLLVSRQEAAIELLARRRARAGLVDFTTYTKPGFLVGEHHKEIAEALESVERGECDRLMIFAPPRHTKSELASRRFPAWFLGRNPDKQLICATYSGDFALDFGREVRGIVGSEEFHALFPDVGLDADSRAANRWHTTQGGVSVYVGVGGPITGRGAHIALIDDPFKNREEADSETRRETVWNWYTSTLRTRLMPGGAIILILTRWHEDDLAGRLLERGAPGEWKVVELPAIRDEGKPTERALWPEWYPLDALRRIKADIGPRDWSALYQQKPQPDEGTFFQRGWFKEWQTLPKLSIYGTSDYAVSADKGDYTVHRVWGVASNGDLYRLGGWRGQTTSDVWIEQLIDLMAEHKPLAWFGESGVIQKAIEPMLIRRMRERNTFCRLEWLPSITDKPTRARGFQARAAMGTVWMEPGADVSEFLTFPAGKHDDDVDTASLIGRALDEAHPAVLSATEQKPKGDRWSRIFDKSDSEEDSWRTA
ncbi:Terminase large subunit gp17-like C-terminal domain-containing protein [Cupriavidus oxalaticus]|uniref:phage terminase large subunit n=1 Tax=Cupriavidus oxalaticus TaxID=96344 RepID=UPI003F734D98